MRLTTSQFQSWAERFYGDLGKRFTWAAASRDSGVKGITLTWQRQRDIIDLKTVLAISRNHGASPLEELAKFERYGQMLSSVRSPSPRDLVSSMHPAYLHAEVARRALWEDLPMELGRWDEYPYRLAAWMNAMSLKSVRAELAEVLKMKPTSVSTKLNGGSSFPADEILEATEALGVDPVLGLVLTGHVTAAEAGYGESIREEALACIGLDELMDLLMEQERNVRKLLHEKSAAEEAMRTLK